MAGSGRWEVGPQIGRRLVSKIDESWEAGLVGGGHSKIVGGGILCHFTESLWSSGFA